jgi:uncharacterized membrane protein
MSGVKRFFPAGLAAFGSVLGLTFASLSSVDYIKHLDRQIHDVHCSYVPGLGAEQSADNACRVAMYSPFAALFRDHYWGGVPISLFAVGAFAFFAAFAVYLLLSNPNAPRSAVLFLATFGLTPLLVSLVMAAISAFRLGHFCKTCVGIYISSALLAIGGVLGAIHEHEPARGTAPAQGPPRAVPAQGPPRNDVPWFFPVGWAVALALFTVTPALLYVSAVPSYASHISGCGKLEKPTEPNNALLHIAQPRAVQPVTLFVDPLCPTCKALHQRLAFEGMLEQLDITLVLFPLDSDCNWMLDRPVHPGACVVSKAILCKESQALEVLEWSYQNQEIILAAAKAGAGLVNVRAMIHDRFPGIDACIDSKDTSLRLNRMLRYIVNNHLQVSTPQMYIGETRVCDEDTDMGLSYTIRRLAPKLKAK